LHSLDRQEDYRRLEGNARGLQMASIAASTVLGGFVGEFSFRATIWLSAIGPLLALVIAFGFVEANPPQKAGDENDSGRPRSATSYSALISDSLRFVLKHRLVRWHVMFLAVLSGSATWLLWLYQPYMQFIGLPIYAFGLAFAFFNLFAALMSRWSQRFVELFARTGALIALMVLQIAPLLLMALVIMPFGFLFILGHQAVRAISRPVVSDRILRYTYADKRATVLSLGSLAGRLFFALTAPLIGLITKTNPMPSALLFQGALLGVILLALLFAYRRIPPKYFRVKKSVLDHQAGTAPVEEAGS
ncbi:MFS transporter, partial [Myxococcota bacterium]